MNLRSIASCLLILAASACPQRPIQGCAVQVSAPGAGGDPAAACAAQRGGKLDPRVRRLPASITGAIASSPERALGPLVQALAQGVDDPFERVKLVHDWIADNIRYDVQGSSRTTPATIPGPRYRARANRAARRATPTIPWRPATGRTTMTGTS